MRQDCSVREIAKTVYIKSCDVIGRAKTKTNHIGREGLKTSDFFAGEKGSHIALRHLGHKTRKDRLSDGTIKFILACCYSNLKL